MTTLSPAAQAVVDAWDAKLNPDPDGLTYLTHDPEHEALAAALEAAADQVLIRPGIPRDEYSLLMRMLDRQIRAIAAELRAQ
jgi:hypothetical protein